MPMQHLPMSDRQATGRHSTESDALTRVEISPVALSEGNQSVPRITSQLGRPTTSLPSQHSTEEASVRVRPLLDGADVEQKSKTTQPSRSSVLQPQTNFESSRAVQPTASTAQPISRVRPQLSTPTDIYPQRHAQLDSGQSMFADRREAASGREAPTPTIEVTIGRIEVRGSSQPEKPKSRSKPAQRGPALSLNDYLKQRQGGKQ
jgi:hypothetical protein